MLHQNNFRVEYAVERTDEKGSCAIFSPVIFSVEPLKLLAIASLEVDKIELLPSIKLLFTPDIRKIDLPAVKIFGPITGRNYTFSLILRIDDKVFSVDNQMIL